MASGNGAEFKNGMAWVIIGGLASSMILTLVVVPVVYYIFDKLTARFRHYRKNRAIEHIKDTLMEEEEVVVSQ
jgi:hydrophobic/amphiphilic exporter-1 (mainly G- bacteria), HAE1 family